VRVLLPPALTRLFPGCPASVELDASTVAEAIDRLDRDWPGMRDRLCDSTPKLRRHINIFVDGERAALPSRLRPDSEVAILTAISGG
jgi:molybdopterin converting factor small subunit